MVTRISRRRMICWKRMQLLQSHFRTWAVLRGSRKVGDQYWQLYSYISHCRKHVWLVGKQTRCMMDGLSSHAVGPRDQFSGMCTEPLMTDQRMQQDAICYQRLTAHSPVLILTSSLIILSLLTSFRSPNNTHTVLTDRFQYAVLNLTLTVAFVRCV